MNEIALRVAGLSKRYEVRKGLLSRAYISAVENVTLSVQRGQTLAIVGESGSGKSTIAKMLIRAIKPTEGSIVFENYRTQVEIANIKPSDLYANVQMVFQDPYSALNPRHKIWQLISAPLSNFDKIRKADRRILAQKYLRLVGLGDELVDMYPSMISGGQRQRICIARALVTRPKILVLDEPLSALDVSVQAQVINLLLSLQTKLGLTYIFISHDLAVVKHIADSVAVMQAGRLVEFGNVSEVLTNSPSHAYTRKLIKNSEGRSRAI